MKGDKLTMKGFEFYVEHSEYEDEKTKNQKETPKPKYQDKNDERRNQESHDA